MPRAMWTGAISFGLVNIPVKLYRATATGSAKSISFHLIHRECGSRIKNKRWCPVHDREVAWDELVKGYEVSKGRYVPIDPEELDAILPDEELAAIAIDSFVELSEVDPIYYDRSYYVSPEGSPKAYALLHQALQDSGRVAIARVILRTRSHLAVVRAQENHLVMETMFYADEVVDSAEVPGLPEKKLSVDKRQEEAARQLLDSMTTDFDITKYRDDYAARVQQLVDEKLKTGEVSEPLPQVEGGGRVIDLMDALKKSLAATERPRAEPKRAAPRKRRTRSHRRPAS